MSLSPKEARHRRVYWPVTLVLVVAVPFLGLAGWFAMLLVAAPRGELLGGVASFGGFGAFFVWVALSGVEIRDGEYVGGGPWYPRINLSSGERVLAECPAARGHFMSRHGHLFVTDARLLFSQAGPSIFLRPFFAVALDRVSRIDPRSVRIGGYAFRSPALSLELMDGGRETFTMSVAAQSKVLSVLFGSDITFDSPPTTSYAGSA